MTPQQFISEITPYAQQSQESTNIPSSFVVSEAALESGWGSSQLALQAFNLFGVKADSSWHGPVLTLPTKEFIKCVWVTQQAKWRKYDSWLSCISDHATFLLTNPRYAPAFKTTNVSDFVHAISSAHYASDPLYSNKIMEIITQHNLTQYDKNK